MVQDLLDNEGSHAGNEDGREEVKEVAKQGKILKRYEGSQLANDYANAQCEVLPMLLGVAEQDLINGFEEKEVELARHAMLLHLFGSEIIEKEEQKKPEHTSA
jgi:hypothetical protein